jgi:hypothetical protein
MKLGRIKKHIFMFLALATALFPDSKAQTGFEFYPIENRYNSYNYNPAFLTSEGQFTLSIFPFAGTSLGYNNHQEVQRLVNTILSDLDQNTKYIDLSKILVEHPTYNQRVESELLSFTYRTKEGFLNFRVSDVASYSASIQGPVSLFIIKPEVKSVELGQVQELPAFFIHYREYSIGYSIPANHKKLSLGFRAKLYFGKSVFSSGISGSVMELGRTYYIKMNGTGKISAPASYPNNNPTTPGLSGISAQKYLMNSGNQGFGIDLGMKYKITPKFSASLSLIDLGKINWKNNLNSKRYIDQFEISGSNVHQIQENGVETITKNSNNISFADSIPSLLNVVPINSFNSSFSTPMPATLYAGLNYQLSPAIKLNLTERFIRIKNLNHNSFSLTANFELSKRVTLNTGFAAIGNAYNNIPVALLFNPDFGQIYLGTDNLLSVLTPESSDFTGFSFGMCFYLFRKRDLFSSPTDDFPYHRPKKVKKVWNSGRIMREFSE